MKLTSIMLSGESEEDDEMIDLASLLGSQKQVYYPGVPAFYGPDTRSVLIAGDICEVVANTVISQMQQLQLESPGEPIKVYVNTVGGDAASAFALYDWMRCLETPVIGIAYGRCSSAGLPILMGADLRFAAPRCRFFYHEVVGGYGVNSVAEIEEASKNYLWYQQTMKDILVTRAKINKTKWKKNFEGKTSFFFDTDFAIEMGIIHDKLEEQTKRVKLAKE
jgi:ATP-dependent Clp protease protease subunit